MRKEGRMKLQLLECWKKEEECFENAVMKDVNGKEFKWPRIKPVAKDCIFSYLADLKRRVNPYK